MVLDASVVVAVAAKEADKEPQASAELARYTALGYEFYAPGVVVAEALHVLCKKLEKGALSPIAHAQAILDLDSLLGFILPPPGGDGSLARRAETLRGNHTCRRSADGLYIALAEVLASVTTTALLTFDEGMAKQAAKEVSSLAVQLLS